MQKPPDMSVEIRAWRASLGLSQPQAAELLGIPVGTLRGWEQRLAACAHPSLLRMAMGFVAREALGTQAE